MDSGGLPIMQALKKRLNWLNANQRVLSENIANADTPDYLAKKLEKQKFGALVDSLSDNRTIESPKRPNAPQSLINPAGAINEKIETDKNAEVGPTGNSVSLEEEMIKVANNQMQYSMAISLYRKNISILKTALGRGGDSN